MFACLLISPVLVRAIAWIFQGKMGRTDVFLT